MKLPEWVTRGIERLLTEATRSRYTVLDATPLGGGSINSAARVDCGGPRPGERTAFFAKWSEATPEGSFESEREGLEMLRDAGSTLRIPEPIGSLRIGTGALLLLEYVAAGAADPGYGGRLAQGLASLHATPLTSGAALFGDSNPNFIGSLPQLNPPSNEWGEFWRDARVRPQLELAFRNNALARSTLWSLLLEGIAETANELATAPSLLHGDLWSGNVFPDAYGRPTLVDPAVYRGDADVDLAMARLFGGFPPDFDACYREARFGTADHEPAVADARTALHQLYPLLVHVNLFGGSYIAGAERAAKRVVAFGH